MASPVPLIEVPKHSIFDASLATGGVGVCKIRARLEVTQRSLLDTSSQVQ